ncbi:MAG: site-specific integrase [Clostridia bacterium]|nr:site-specific integrase [Clostridia bacterium]
MPRKQTRNAQGSGTIRKYNDKLWQGRFTIGRDPGTGKQIQRSVYGKTQAEVREKMTEILASLDKGTYIEPSRLTVGEWLDTWLNDYCVDIKSNTLSTYQTQIEQHLKPAFGAMLLSEVHPHYIQRFYIGLLRNAEHPLSEKSIKNIHGIFHRALKQAVLLRYIAVNPADSVQLPRVQKKDIRPLEKEQVSAFLTAIKGSDYETALTVALFTGVRQGELIGLSWDRVDFKQGTILIDRQMILDRNTHTYMLAPTKTDTTRKIKPAPLVMRTLAQQRTKQMQQRLMAGELWNEGAFAGVGLVFTNAFGAHLCPNTLTHNVRKIGERIGIQGLRFHDLRHTYAVLALLAGDDLKTVSASLGHSTITTTADIYMAYTDDMKNDSSARMEALINGISNL